MHKAALLTFFLALGIGCGPDAPLAPLTLADARAHPEQRQAYLDRFAPELTRPIRYDPAGQEQTTFLTTLASHLGYALLPGAVERLVAERCEALVCVPDLYAREMGLGVPHPLLAHAPLFDAPDPSHTQPYLCARDGDVRSIFVHESVHATDEEHGITLGAVHIDGRFLYDAQGRRRPKLTPEALDDLFEARAYAAEYEDIQARGDPSATVSLGFYRVLLAAYARTLRSAEADDAAPLDSLFKQALREELRAIGSARPQLSVATIRYTYAGASAELRLH